MEDELIGVVENIEVNSNDIQENDEQQIVEQIDSDIQNNIEELNNNIDDTTNCLALTVRENYHMVVVKNFVRKSIRVSWKVALSIFTINFLNMFL